MLQSFKAISVYYSFLFSHTLLNKKLQALTEQAWVCFFNFNLSPTFLQVVKEKKTTL